MKEENDTTNNDNNGNNNNVSTCPPIEIGMHQNSYKPKKDIEKR